MDLYFGNFLILIPITFPPIPKYLFKVAILYVRVVNHHGVSICPISLLQKDSNPVMAL